MVELRILGPLEIGAADGRDVAILARQPKRVALLAYLASTPRRMHRRETLLALFWPESDDSHARQALNQTLHMLRRSLGDHAIVTRGDDEVGVNSEAVWCDVPAFESALEARRPAEALTLYRGAFLEGFFPGAGLEFERWIDRERDRLRERASEGAWAMADAAAAEGDQVQAERWARRAVALLPADEAVVRRLMNFLAALGDRAAALRAYEAFAWRLGEDHELRPSPETDALALAIRNQASGTRGQNGLERPSDPTMVDQPGATTASARQITDQPPRPAARRRFFVAVAIAAVATTLGLGYHLRNQPGVANAAAPLRVLVLPFQNLGPPEDAYFADGITDEITVRLAMVPELEVVGGQTTLHYRGTTLTPRQLAQEVGVDYVLEGTVTRDLPIGAGTTVRLRLQLIDTHTETQVWSEVMDQRIMQLFPLLSGVAERVVNELHVALAKEGRPDLKVAPTTNLEAYDFYLQGREFKRRSWTEGNTRAAIAMFQRAVEEDSAFALAYAWLSYAHTDAYWLLSLGAEHLDQAKDAAERALRLDPLLPDAHMALGFYYYACCEDYPHALTELQAARAARPGDSFVTMFIGNVYKRSGRWDEAATAYQQAAKQDPRWAGPLLNLAQLQLWLRRYHDAEQTLIRAQSLQPGDVMAYSMRAWIPMLESGDLAGARAIQREAEPVTDGFSGMKVWFDLELLDRRAQAALERVRGTHPRKASDESEQWLANDNIRRAVAYRLLGDSALAREQFDSACVELQKMLTLAFPRSRTALDWARSGLAIAYAGAGQPKVALEQVKLVLDSDPLAADAMGGTVTLQNLALAYVLLGRRTEAIDLLHSLLARPALLSQAVLRLDPVWDNLRGDPKFERLLN